MRAIGRPGKNICTSSHRATRELYAKVPSHRAPIGAVCEGSMHIELRSELYAKGALCGSTKHHKYLNMNRISHFSEHREEIIVFPISAIDGGLVALTTEKFIEKQLLNLA